MQPTLEIPVVIQNVQEEVKTVAARIMPTEIEYYYPGFNFGSVIVMKSGHSFTTELNVGQIDEALIAYHNSTKRMPGKFGNLSLNSINDKPKSKLHATN